MDTKTEVERLYLMVIDHIIMLFIGFAFLICGLFLGIELQKDNDIFLFSGITLGAMVYLNKDYFDARSPAKRMFNYQVVKDKESYSKATRLQCFIRNLTIIIFPIELVMIVINPEKRLGDYLAKTKVIKYELDWGEENHWN